jgi:radical SAM superfamily enzyme YgiQ (UPF0313 family)
MKLELINPSGNMIEDKLDVPLGLLTLASYVKIQKPNIEVRINDLSGLSERDWDIRPADFYGISVYTSLVPVMHKIINKCMEVNPQGKIIVGGPHPSAVPGHKDFNDVDYVVVGPGEEALVSILEGFKEHRIVMMKHIESFPFPRFDLINVRSYTRTIDNISSLSLITSLGCKYHCSFCGTPPFHKKIQFCPPEKVRDFIVKIQDDYGINAIKFEDDMFTYKGERFFKLMEFIKPLNIKFRCLGRAGNDTEEMYEKLADAGCVQIACGIESGSQYMLNRMNKKSTVQDNFNVIKWAKKYGITSRAFFIMGFPGETRASIEDTKNFILQADPDQWLVSNFIPYPGTDVANNPKKYGIIRMSDDWSDYYQVNNTQTGGLTIDTEWLDREEFRELELEFREWLAKNVPFRGAKLKYEKEINR